MPADAPHPPHGVAPETLVAAVLGARSLYDVMGVRPDANARELRAQYLRLSRQLHPDKCRLPRAKEAFQRLAHAYHTLSDAHLRTRYDQTGLSGLDGPGANEHTLTELMDQLLREFWSGNFDNILLLVDVLNATNPELQLPKDTVAHFLETTRSTVQEVDVFIRIVRADTIKLWELKDEFAHTPWLDLVGMAHIGVRALQVPVIVALAVNQRRPVLFTFVAACLAACLALLQAADMRISAARVALRPAWDVSAESVRLLYALLSIPVMVMALLWRQASSRFAGKGSATVSPLLSQGFALL